MVTNLSLHPAADILRDRLLVDVAEENQRIIQAIGDLDPLCDFLGKIELHLGSGRVISSSLNAGFIVNSFNGLPCLCVDVDQAPCPLVDLRQGRAVLSGQEIGTFPGVADPIVRVTDDNRILVKIIFSSHGIISGELCVSDEDLILFKERNRDEELMDYLTTGTGLHNTDVIMFIPDTIYFIMTENLLQTITALGPLPTYENEDTIFCKPLPVDQHDCIKCPTSDLDDTRLTIANALEFDPDDRKLLEENHNLKCTRHRLSKAGERIRTVEIHNALEETQVSLHDGVQCNDSQGTPMWRISLRHLGKPCFIVANSLPILEISVSGIRFPVNRMDIHVMVADAGRYFTMKFMNGGQIFGYLDSSSDPEWTDSDLDEVAEGFMSFERQFPPGFTFMAVFLYLPFDTVRGALDVLGIEDDEKIIWV